MVWPLFTKQERARRAAADWLARLEGQPDSGDREAFQRWYHADPLHAQTFERLKGVYGDAGRLARSELGRARALPSTPRRQGLPSYAMAAGVAVLLAVSGALLLGRPDAMLPQAEAQTLLFTTTVGEIRHVPLPDGSRMTLDAKSDLRVRMTKDVRQVTLREGRARFALARRDPRPFSVEAGQTRVRGEAGTFDVGLIGGNTVVQSIQGTVSVETASAVAEEKPVRAQPGQVVVIPAGDTRIQTRSIDRAAALWPTGRIEFDDTPLDQVLVEANRYSRGTISLGDPDLARLRVTGTFQAGDLAGLARSLEAAFGLRLENSATGQFVLRPNNHEQQQARQKSGG